MKKLIILFLFFHGFASAEFYRCKINDKVTYQSKPCQQGVSSKQIEVKKQHYGKTRDSLKEFMVKTQKDAQSNEHKKNLKALQKQKIALEKSLNKELKSYIKTIQNSPTTPIVKKNKSAAKEKMDAIKYKYSSKLDEINKKIEAIKKKSK